VTVLFDASPPVPPSSTGTSAKPSFSSTTASRATIPGVATTSSLSTMPTSLEDLEITPLTGALRLSRKASNPSPFGQSRICTCTVPEVWKGARLSVPEVPT
jgi:hypothetical protein